MISLSHCPICFDEVHQHSVLEKDYRTIRYCGSCGHYYTRQREENYHELYIEDLKYHADREGQVCYLDRFEHDVKIGDLRLNTYRKVIGDQFRYLDVGCANGGFLKAAKDRGLEIYGMEPNAKMALKASENSGCPVYLDYRSLGMGVFDVITYHDVLEHIVSPTLELKAVSEYLRNFGHIIVDVPTAEDPRFIINGKNWHHLKPLEHLHFFTEGSFRCMLDYIPFLSITHIDRPILGKLVFYLQKRPQ